MVMFAKYPKVADYDLSSIKVAVCGAAPLSKEIEDMVKEKLKIPCVHQGYGMTEIGVSHINGKTEFKHKSVGKRHSLVQMKIVNVDTGKPCGVNEEGEIWIKGPHMCLGYLNNEEETKNFFTEDGWAKTGDIGREDEDGFLFVVDRLKELIKYKGYQVAPATLEDILLRHNSVADVGVVGLPDEEAGELPRAYVVKKAGKEVTEEELVDFVNGQVAPHMKLRGGVEFVTEIPRTLSGKILRKTLRERAKTWKEQKDAAS
ncbi:luciferin 4-monooxygenase-like [Ruditapes philippinarum]|uniref:luciferin 4-monooxygenase-like n=1 Tax=Ruditapes philippinarum TaxID=129788 RepID=UPI00295AEF75|nr:luciferin 4-monooxygenase-like [Ruditapes philippinarum]